ncbi:hypothetical protein SLS63_013723 [Diaporthe eres]|uniref:Metallo-beta-lactamase domain-containing protein n=1 Tax=Diaporthe eres TaxID=83184 RepID=A0ABR1NMM7_DIAER
MSSQLRSAVYSAPAIPVSGRAGVLWSPISCTLVYSSTEAVLVDTPITIAQTEDLIKWIEGIAPNRKLRYIYITHGHGDHFFGIPILLKRFPEAVPLATTGTVAHMEQQVEEKYYNTTWESRFPGQIHQPFILAKPIPADWSGRFQIDGRWDFEAKECGHSDTYSSTILWVPALRLAVCGDVVYGQVHQMLMEANTRAKRDEWIRGIELIQSLDPAYVVAGHKRAEEIDGIWHLDSTKKYIEDFGKVLQNEPNTEAEVFSAMMELYPDRLNPGALKLSAMGVFMTPKQTRI